MMAPHQNVSKEVAPIAVKQLVGVSLLINIEIWIYIRTHVLIDRSFNHWNVCVIILFQKTWLPF